MDAKTALAAKFGDVGMFRACEQCGCCASACPITGEHDFNVRRIVRHIELELIQEIANTPFPWYCTTCGRCESVCPNGIAILDIIRPLRSMTPESVVPDWPPCTRACPAGIDIPSYLRFIAQGKPEEACAVILEKVPFPGILGRICMHPCEDSCRRLEVFDQPVSICTLKRYAAENGGGALEKAVEPGSPTGHKVAVVGAGPAGLTAAFYLRKKGHEVVVFEERSKAGGMMRYGIPAYRLPEEVIEKEINRILSVGIQLETGKRLGRDFHLDTLRSDGFEAVFIAVGLQMSRKMELEGADLDDVMWGMDFLRQVRDGAPVVLKERVLVVGGGNVAVDVALTALRLGAKQVLMACLESQEEMPASRWEIETALEEGVQLMTSWGPKRILSENGRVTGAELVQCASVFDAEGNFCPSFNETEEKVAVDQVIMAIGQAADLTFATDSDAVSMAGDRILVNGETQETDLPGVFAGGDVAGGAGAIIDAISSGRGAASAMDRYLGGDGNIEEILVPRPDTAAYTGKRERGFADLKRAESPQLPVADRHGGFSEVALCLDGEQAVEEAKRCFQCDLELWLARTGAQASGK
jgi:NADPH-dependent glutamate synthase beta subunit-like oxidoreductase